MRSNSQEQVEHHECPVSVAQELRLAGGENRYGEPMFRLVWGYDRIVPMSGEWQEWAKYAAALTDKLTGHTETREFVKLERSVIETRMVPKYLPANCWHLEMWRPPEEYACYGAKENWTKLGEEVVAGMTIDTAGEFPDRGEYELCYPITDDLTVNGNPVPLESAFVAEIVQMIRRAGEQKLGFLARRAAIEQRIRREEEGFSRRAMDVMKDGMRPFASEPFVTVPKDVN